MLNRKISTWFVKQIIWDVRLFVTLIKIYRGCR